MNIEPKKVWVVGHKNPDTDSICAAISYAYLKNQLRAPVCTKACWSDQ